jgi:hypothetical protein
MPGMIPNSKLLPNHPRDAFERPEVRPETERLGTGKQDRFELAELGLGQFAIPPRPASPEQSLGAAGLPTPMPAARSLTADAQTTHDIGLAHASIEEPACFQPPSLFCRIIRATARSPFHATGISQVVSFVTRICEAQ